MVRRQAKSSAVAKAWLFLALVVAGFAVGLGRATTVEAVDPTIVWDGGGTSSSWSEATNWNPDRVPNATDIVAFDGTSTKASTIDAAFPGTVNELRLDHVQASISASRSLTVASHLTMTKGYLAMGVHQLTVEGNYGQSGGTLNASASSTIAARGDLVQSAGSFSSFGTIRFEGAGAQTVAVAGQAQDVVIAKPSGTLSQGADLNIRGDLSYISGGFDAAGKKLTLSGSNPQTIDTAAISFHDIGLMSSNTMNIVGELRASGGLIVQGAVSTNGGPIKVAGNVVVTDQTWAGSSFVTLVGSAVQTFNAGAESGALPNLRIDKSGGTAVLGGTMILDGSLDVVAGAVDANQLTLRLSGSSPGTVDADIGTVGQLHFYGNGEKSISGSLGVTGLIDLVNATTINGGVILARGDVIARDSSYVGTAALQLSGSANQTISTGGTSTGLLRNLSVNKSGGTATVTENLRLAGSFAHQAGSFAIAGVQTLFVSSGLALAPGPVSFGNVTFTNNASGTISGTLLVGGDLTLNSIAGGLDGGEIAVSGNLVSDDASIAGSTSIRLIGTGSQAISGQDLTDGDLFIDKPSGSVTLADALILNGTGQKLRLLRSELSTLGYGITAPGGVSVEGGTLRGGGAITGSLSVSGPGEVALKAVGSSGTQLAVSGPIALSASPTLLVDLTGVATGGSFPNLVTYASRTGSWGPVALANNLHGFTPYVANTAISTGIVANSAPSGSLANVTMYDTDSDLAVNLTASFSDQQSASNLLTYSITGNTNPTLLTVTSTNGVLTLDPTPTAAGSTVITVRATDLYGEWGAASFNVTVALAPDTTKPVIAISSPLANASVPVNTPVTANFSCSDAESGIASCVATLDGTAITTGAAVTTSSPGTFTLQVTATDMAGNSQSATRALVVLADTTKPTIGITSPAADMQVIVRTTLMFDYACADLGGSTLATCDGTVNGSATATGIALDTNQPGTLHLSVTAADNASNQHTETRTVTVVRAPDIIDPVIIVSSPAAAASVALNSTVHVGFGCTDSGGSGLATCTATANGAAVLNGAALDTGQPGTVTVTVTATDNDGNSASVTHGLTVLADTLSPAPVITTPTDNVRLVQGSTMNAVYTCTDSGGSGLASCTATVTIDAGSPVPINSGTPLNTALPATIVVRVTGIDNAGNSATVTHTLVVERAADTIGPVIVIGQPASNLTVPLGSALTAVFSCSDAGGSGLATCLATLNGSVIVSGTAIDTMSPGSQVLTVTASDHDGNTSAASRTVTVAPDTTKPSATIVAPIAGLSVIEGSIVAIDFECTDTGGSNLATCTATQNGLAILDGGVIDTANRGPVTLRVTATDGAGNETVVSRTMTVTRPPDTEQPTISITAPVADGSVVEGTPVTLSYQCSDGGGSALASCQAKLGELLLTDGSSLPTSAPGTLVIDVTAADGDGNTASARRTISVTARPVVVPPVVVAGPSRRLLPPYTGLSGTDGTIGRLYLALLGRQPDPSGFAYWSLRSKQGVSIAAIVDFFLTSQEFRITYGGLDNSAFIERLYREVMLRPADDQGRAYWIQLLSSGGLDRAGLTLWFAESNEFKVLTGSS